LTLFQALDFAHRDGIGGGGIEVVCSVHSRIDEQGVKATTDIQYLSHRITTFKSQRTPYQSLRVKRGLLLQLPFDIDDFGIDLIGIQGNIGCFRVRYKNLLSR